MNTNRPDRAVLERMGDMLSAGCHFGLVIVTMPERMPLPRQQIIVDLSNRIREDGLKPDFQLLFEYAADSGIPAARQRELLDWVQIPNIYLVRCFGPDGDLERMREYIYHHGAAIHDALLVEAAAEKLRRGQDASAEIARLKGGAA